ncbi:phosphatase 2C-like domain-containing protein [Xylaria digitata]|nr:phosphatase 2C-like domain-containing protein [Xylaria digitata]
MANPPPFQSLNTVQPPSEPIEVPVHDSPPTDKLIIEPSPRVVTHAGDGSEWMTWGIFDGHHGYKTAELLETQLLPFVRHSLIECADEFVPEVMIRMAIRKAFMKLDNAIIESAAAIETSDEPIQDKVRKLAPANSGSCALLSIYDPATGYLRVACTGNSKAVLGEGDANNVLQIDLSKDQTPRNEMEVAKVNREHAREKDIFRDGRIFGMQVTRSFGDGRYKWPLGLQRRLAQGPYGYLPIEPAENYETPPYLTAEPVIITHRILGKSCFLIMGSAGFWATMTDDQAVELVASWLSKRGDDFGMTKFSENKTKGGGSRKGSTRQSNTQKITKPLGSKSPGLSSPKVDIRGPNNTKGSLDQRIQTICQQLETIRQKYGDVPREGSSTQESKSYELNLAPGSQGQGLEPRVQGPDKGLNTKGNNNHQARTRRYNTNRIDSPMSAELDDKDEFDFRTDEGDEDEFDFQTDEGDGSDKDKEYCEDYEDYEDWEDDEDDLGGKESLGGMHTQGYATSHSNTFQEGMNPDFLNAGEMAEYDNAAFFLIRTGLSRGDHGLIPIRPAPGSQVIWEQRDNITVQVVFFHPTSRDRMQSFTHTFK